MVVVLIVVLWLVAVDFGKLLFLMVLVVIKKEGFKEVFESVTSVGLTLFLKLFFFLKL